MSDVFDRQKLSKIKDSFLLIRSYIVTKSNPTDFGAYTQAIDSLDDSLDSLKEIMGKKD